MNPVDAGPWKDYRSDMARVGRIVIAGMAHHVTQRARRERPRTGNRRQRTFFRDSDYRAYLARMAEWCRRYGLAVWAYCLMPNHAHLVVVPADEDACAWASARPTGGTLAGSTSARAGGGICGRGASALA